MKKNMRTRSTWAALAASGVAATLFALPMPGAGGPGAKASGGEAAEHAAPGSPGPGCAPPSSAALAGCAPACGLPSRPNFVLIVTDDQDAASMRAMPRVQERLARRGVTFANMFVANPICCPSQVSILTGQYSHNNGILHNVPPQGGFRKFVDLGGDRSTLATWLHDAGYLTGRVGKYLVGYPIGSTYVPPGWDAWHSTFEGFSPYFNYALNENGAVVPYGARPEDYITDVLGRRAVEFLADAEAVDDQPFFLVFSPTAPHGGSGPNGPPTPAPRHQGLFAGATAPRTPSFNEADVSDKPAAIRNRPPLTAAQIAALDREHQLRLEALQAVDEAVERIVDALDALGELEDTYILFTSDNGYHLGQHRLFDGKGNAYEEDIRVPLIVRGPGVPEGETLDHLALNIDFAPTVCELAGVIPGRVPDGRSLAPLLARGTPPPHDWRNDFLVEIYRIPGGPVDIGEPGLALRTRHELYAEYASGFREFYRLHQDPDQLENAASSAGAGYLKKLSRRLAELAQCRGGACD
jgi:N-acetylglucosamine-6-sulfatase